MRRNSTFISPTAGNEDAICCRFGIDRQKADAALGLAQISGRLGGGTMGDRFLKVSRGVANTAIYFRVREEDVDAVNRQYQSFGGDDPGCFTEWVSGEGLGNRAVPWEQSTARKSGQ